MPAHPPPANWQNVPKYKYLFNITVTLESVMGFKTEIDVGFPNGTLHALTKFGFYHKPLRNATF